MTTSIVIPCLNQWIYTERCLDAVEQNTEDYELVLIDNGFDETIVEAPERVDVYIKNKLNQGFARSCNQGASVATGDYLVFLNNDTEVQPGWLKPLISALSLADIAGPKLIYPDGTIQCVGIGVDFDQPPGQEAWNIKDEAEARNAKAITGACMVVKRERFTGFDEGFWNGYEDVDYCQGRKCKVVTDSVVIHHESKSDPQARFGRAAENIARLRGRWA